MREGRSYLRWQRSSQKGTCPTGRQQAVLQADAVETGYGERFIAVPQMESDEAYRDMEDFIATVRNPHIRELLEVAITGRGAFRRFKDVLYNYPHEEKRWFAFKEARMVERVREWLEAHDIEPDGCRRRRTMTDEKPITLEAAVQQVIAELGWPNTRGRGGPTRTGYPPICS